MLIKVESLPHGLVTMVRVLYQEMGLLPLVDPETFCSCLHASVMVLHSAGKVYRRPCLLCLAKGFLWHKETSCQVLHLCFGLLGFWVDVFVEL